MTRGTVLVAQCMGLLDEDEMLIQDAPLSEVLAQAASRAQRGDVDQGYEGDESDRPTTPVI